jgi:hypothetical protein
MSHNKIRSDKKCLNCGAEVPKRFCPECGQENIEPKQSFWQLTAHFLEDLTHFDGKFFSTMKYLVTKPGLLTLDYIEGKRARHINPIRMYLFVSATFFLLLMSFFVHEDSSPFEVTNDTKKAAVDSALTKLPQSQLSLAEAIKEETDSEVKSTIDTLVRDTSEGGVNVLREGNNIHIKGNSGSSWFPDETRVSEYDSVQKALPEKERDGWLKHYWMIKIVGAIELWEKDPKRFEDKFYANFYHSLPYMFFISLPLIALILKLLYIRRKQFNYVSHIIFLLHFYCLVFIAFIIAYTLREIGGWPYKLSLFVHLGYIIYLYKAMRCFYGQRRFKTFIKYYLLVSMGLTLLGLLTVVFMVKSL